MRDPFWSDCSSEFQLRDRMAGALAQRGWVVSAEVCLPDLRRVDLVLRAPSPGLRVYLVEVKQALMSEAQVLAALAQVRGYCETWERTWPDDGSPQGVVVAGRIGVYTGDIAPWPGVLCTASGFMQSIIPDVESVLVGFP